MVGAEDAQAAHQHRHFRCGQGEKLRAIDQEFLARPCDAGAAIVAEAVGAGLEHGEGRSVRLLGRRIRPARGEGHGHRLARGLRRRLDSRGAGEDDQVGQGDLLAAGLGGVEALADPFQGRQHPGELGGLVDLPVLLRRQPDAGAIGPAPLVRPTEGSGRGPGRGDQFRDRQARGEDLGLQGRDVGGVDQGMVHCRHRVLPDQNLGRDFRPEIAGARAHVAVGQLEPGAGESVGESLRILVEPAGDRLVDGIEPKGEVGGRHHRGVLDRRIVGVGDHVLGAHVLGPPLMRAGGALHQFPLIAEQHVEIAVVPGGRVGLPGAFNAAGDGVHAPAGAMCAEPAEASRFHGRTLGLGSDMGVGSSPVSLAEGMTAGNQSDSFLVVHGHAGEGLAHVPAGGDRIGITIGALRVDVDQPHLDRPEGLGQHPVAGVTVIAQPFGLGTPVDVLLGFPDIGAPAGEAEGLEAHGLHGDVAGQDHQVGPGQAVAVLLLDRPEQAARLVEVAVVRPGVDGRKTLVTGSAAAAAIRDPVGAGAVPGHADEQRAVVTPVRRPPVLGVGHQGVKVSLDRRQIEGPERFGVVEARVHRIGLRRMLAEDLQVKPVGPPVGIGLHLRGSPAAVSERALAFIR